MKRSEPDVRPEAELSGAPVDRWRRKLAHNVDRISGELRIIAVVERAIVGEC
jgi:hypothetical protein